MSASFLSVESEKTPIPIHEAFALLRLQAEILRIKNQNDKEKASRDAKKETSQHTRNVHTLRNEE